MAKKTSPWTLIKRNRFPLFLTSALVVTGAFILVNQEMKLQELKYEANQLQVVASQKQKAVDQLREAVENLDTDAAKEALARQKLNMIKKDEILYIVEPAEGEN